MEGCGELWELVRDEVARAFVEVVYMHVLVLAGFDRS